MYNDLTGLKLRPVFFFFQLTVGHLIDKYLLFKKDRVLRSINIPFSEK